MTNSNGKRSRNIFAIRAPPVNVFKSASFKLLPCNAVSKSSRNSCVKLNIKKVDFFLFFYEKFFSLIFVFFFYPTRALVSEVDDELSNIAVERYSATSFDKSRCRACKSRFRSGKHLSICSVNCILSVRCRNGTPIRSAISLKKKKKKKKKENDRKFSYRNKIVIPISWIIGKKLSFMFKCTRNI